MSLCQSAADIGIMKGWSGSRRPSVASHAQRPFLLLAGGVRADRGAEEDRPGVHCHAAATDQHREAVEPARRRPGLLLAHPVVLRPVARALEPLRRLAPRDPAPEVDAPLIERDEALLHAGVDGLVVHLLGLRQIGPGITLEVG